jgi:predicted nucleotidyltransferase
MTDPATQGAAALPPGVEEGLTRFVAAARAALGAELRAVVLHGSAAEGRLRATSDVNLVLVLRRFAREGMDALREPLREARAAFGAAPLFLLEGEIPDAAEAFAVKFGDISRRRRVLFGDDPFAALAISREGRVRRLRQVLLNQAMRMRERYATLSLREEQLARALADVAGPLRGAASALLELEGSPAPGPKEALERVADAARLALATLSRAREQERLAPGEAAPAFLALLELTERLRARAARLA